MLTTDVAAAIVIAVMTTPATPTPSTRPSYRVAPCSFATLDRPDLIGISAIVTRTDVARVSAELSAKHGCEFTSTAISPDVALWELG